LINKIHELLDTIKRRKTAYLIPISTVDRGRLREGEDVMALQHQTVERTEDNRRTNPYNTE